MPAEPKPSRLKTRKEQRFEREAKALQKNLQKRKQQQLRRAQAAKENHNG